MTWLSFVVLAVAILVIGSVIVSELFRYRIARRPINHRDSRRLRRTS